MVNIGPKTSGPAYASIGLLLRRPISGGLGWTSRSWRKGALGSVGSQNWSDLLSVDAPKQKSFPQAMIPQASHPRLPVHVVCM
jgi:hypothetical protein